MKELIRVQRKRTKGFRLNPDTRYVGRGRGEYGKYGNPFTLREGSLEDSLAYYSSYLDYRLDADPSFLDELKNYKQIACWCSVTAPCHGDIIIGKMQEMGLIG